MQIHSYNSTSIKLTKIGADILNSYLQLPNRYIIGDKYTNTFKNILSIFGSNLIDSTTNIEVYGN